MDFVKSILAQIAAVIILNVSIVLQWVSPQSELDIKITESTLAPQFLQEPIAPVSKKVPMPPIPLPLPEEPLKPKTPPPLPRIIDKKISSPVILVAPVPVPAPAVTPVAVPVPVPAMPPPPTIPKIDEDELMAAVVRIKCGKVYGSGFSTSPDGLVLTVAHVVIEAINDGILECDIIFPAKHKDFGYFSERYYWKGKILSSKDSATAYKEKGIDIAAFKIIPIPGEPIFASGFPSINYPFCEPDTLDDKVLLFGYAANIGTSAAALGSILSRFEGSVLQYAEITGVKPQPSEDFKDAIDYIPQFSYTLDQEVHHPVVIIASSNNFAGASGGLVFNISKNCIIGTNSAVGTVIGDPRIFGFIYNFKFQDINRLVELLTNSQ